MEPCGSWCERHKIDILYTGGGKYLLKAVITPITQITNVYVNYYAKLTLDTYGFPALEGGERFQMAEPESKPVLVKNSSTNSCRKSGRRVAFEVPSGRNHQSHSSGLDNNIDTSIDDFDKGHHHPCFLACCAWSCLAIFIFVIVFLFLGISYLAFLKAGMPKVNVRTFNMTKLQVDSNSQKMDAIINLGLRFSNKNEEFKLLYGPLFVEVISNDVLLGRTKLKGFSQVPKNDTNLDMTMTTNDANVNVYAIDDLKSDIKAYEMVFDVYVSGNIGVQIGSLHMINVPFLSSCEEIKRIDVDYGRKPDCDIKMFSYRPSVN